MDPLLDFFLHFDTLIVKETIQENGFFSSIVQSRKRQGQFNIYGVNNDLILIGKEYFRNDVNDLFSFQKYRPYKISIRTLDGSEILKIKRDKQCGRQGCFCGFLCCCAVESCHQDILIYCGDSTSTPGTYLGRVKEEFSWFKPVFTVFDDDNNEHFKIVGHKIKNNSNFKTNKMVTSQSLSSYYQMKIYQKHSSSSCDPCGADGDEIGEISQLYSGLEQSLFNDQNNIYIDFPPKSSINQKSILIGSLFLINSLYFGLKSNPIEKTTTTATVNNSSNINSSNNKL